MKTKLPFAIAAIVAFIICSFQKTNGQNIAPFWSLSGNSNTTATSRLGTTTWMPLRFITNGLERMRVNNGGNVGIGTTAPAQRLHVVGNGVFTGNLTAGGLTAEKYGEDAIAVFGKAQYGQFTVGVKGEGVTGVIGNGTSSVFSTGLGVSGSGFIGVFGSGDQAGVLGFGEIGVQGSGVGGVEGSTEAGGFCGVCAIGDGGSYGLYARGGSEYAGYFAGSVFSTGSFVTSDSRLKKNITDFKTSAMEFINKLQPKSYEFRQDGNYKKMNLPTGIRYGIMAEELEQVLPGLVKETKFNTVRPMRAIPAKTGKNSIPQTTPNPATEKGEIINFKAVNYTELVPILVKALQEVNEKVIKLEEQNQQLIEIIKRLDRDGGNSMSDSKAWMKQNTPNPVRVSTTIQFSIPDDTRSARILITNMKGQQIKFYNVNGAGSIDFSTGTLPAGTYNYSLVTDGKTIITKKLVIAR